MEPLQRWLNHVVQKLMRNRIVALAALDFIDRLRAEREGRLRERIRFLCRRLC